MTTLHGNNPNKVIELLIARRDCYGLTDEKSHRKLALVVEGGAMRGVLSAGSLLAIDQLNFKGCFNEVYATSAGSVNAAYFLSGQGDLGIEVYFDDISNRRFFNPLRLKKIVDVDYVYDYIVPELKPLDEGEIRKNSTRLYVSVSDVKSGKNVLIDVHNNPEPIAKILKASNAIPILYNKTVSLNSKQYVDGGATNTLPVKQAIENGCTDILVLLTRSENYSSKAPNKIQQLMYYLLIGRKYPELMTAYKEIHLKSNLNRKLALGFGLNKDINIATICPTETELIVNRTTIDRNILVEGAYMQAAKTFRIFSGNLDKLDKLFSRYRNKM